MWRGLDILAHHSCPGPMSGVRRPGVLPKLPQHVGHPHISSAKAGTLLWGARGFCSAAGPSKPTPGFWKVLSSRDCLLASWLLIKVETVC